MASKENTEKTEKKKSTNFTIQLDILLLREVLATNPYGEDTKAKETAKWAEIHKNLESTLKENEYLTVRQITDRMKKLLQKFKASEMASLRA